MTKFNVTYIAVLLPTTSLVGRRAIVSLPVSTAKDALALLSSAGGFKNELPSGENIAFSAVLQVELMES